MGVILGHPMDLAGTCEDGGPLLTAVPVELDDVCDEMPDVADWIAHGGLTAPARHPDARMARRLGWVSRPGRCEG